jgi:putative Mg2+ transporter-C (MgtC) family protein
VNPDLSIETEINLALRLVVGLSLGAIIGFERELHRQPAGFRTHSLVALWAALFTVVSAYGCEGIGADPTRIAAQIVTGIGFLGAGVILQYRGQIRGLTTAASLWSVAAIGTAAGAGMLVLATVATVLILIVLSLLNRVEALARRHLDLPPDQHNIKQIDREVDEGKSEDHS